MYHWAQNCQIIQLTEGCVDWLTNVDIVLVLELISKLVMTGSLQNDILFGLSSIVNPVCFGLFSSLVLITEVELFVVVLVVVLVIVEMDNFFLLRLVCSWILFLLGEGSTEAVTATSVASLAFLPLGAKEWVYILGELLCIIIDLTSTWFVRIFSKYFKGSSRNCPLMYVMNSRLKLPSAEYAAPCTWGWAYLVVV